MALDRASRRLFIPAYGNGGYRAFQLDERGLPKNRSAMYVIGRESLYGRRSSPAPDERELAFPGAVAVFDSSTQRLFGLDRFNNRILVFRAAPDQIRPYAAATVVIGQPDFKSTIRGIGPDRMGMVMGADLDEEGQRLFVADPPNNRVLVFDVHPDRLDIDPEATVVLGQSDFRSRSPGLGPERLSRPSSVAYDPVFKRLFVSDGGNHRVLIFDADPASLASGAPALAVMGQPDFNSRRPRPSLDQLKPESLAYDWVHHRLLISEDLEHRVMVYDAHPDRIGGPATALAVIGQPDPYATHPAVSRNRLAMPRLAVDPTVQKLYVSEGFPAGNRISIWDISPENLKTGMAAVDVLGQETSEGGPDFHNRMAQGKLDGHSLAAARALVLDPRDHRLFVADEYNHRVVVWQLDHSNRIAGRAARWVLGQPGLNTSLMGDPSPTNMAVPLAVAYDTSSRRLFVGDGYHNRVLVYEAAPGKLENGMAASVVIGQKDFESVEFSAGPAGLNFDVRMGRGIASNFIPMGLAVDEEGQRLFVSDGRNNRVLVYDISRDRLRNGAPARAVLGQLDFDGTDPGRGATGLHDPGHLAYDPVRERLFVIDSRHRRVMVFEASADRLVNGSAAVAVLGKPDFQTPPSRPPGMAAMMSMPDPEGRTGPRVDERSFFSPNGIACDAQRNLLFVSDAGSAGVSADRVLVFDAANMVNGAAAVAVLGTRDATSGSPRVYGGPRSHPGQFTLRDARGLAVDSEFGRLFVTGSFASRVVVYHFPRAEWGYALAANSLARYNTPDAVDLGVRAQPAVVFSASLESGAGPPAAIALFSRTRMFVDERTQRHSRMLISEAAVSASTPVSEAAVFIEGRASRTHFVYLYNPTGSKQSAALELVDGSGGSLGEWRRDIPAAQQLTIRVEDLGVPLQGENTLLIRSGSLALVALRQTENGRGERIFSPAPVASRRPRGGTVTLPWIVNGGGHRSQIVLINPAHEMMSGSVIFHDAEGRRTPLGTASETVRYSIPARSSRAITTDGAGARAVDGYALVAPDSGPAPAAAALLNVRAGDVWISENLVSASRGREFAFAVNLQPTLIRHGEIDTRFLVTNPAPEAARVTFRLGEVSVLREVAAGRQIRASARELFGVDAAGLVLLASDRDVSVAALQITINLRAETVALELPSLTDAKGGVFAYIPNGAGLSTEIRLGNLSTAVVKGRLKFRTRQGEPATETILR